MNWLLFIAFLVFAVWGVKLERYKIREEKRAKAELAYLKDMWGKTDNADIRETLVAVANSLLDREFWLVRQFDEDTRGWWREKIKESDEKSVV